MVGMEPRDSVSKLNRSQKQLLQTIMLVSIILVGKFIGAFTTNSLSLLSDCWHLVTDLLALIISWWGVRVATRAANCRFTFGYRRFSILTALINNLSLIVVSVYIFYQAVLRYIRPESIEPSGMIVFSILGLIVNLIIIGRLRGNSENANVRSVLLHFLGDALSDIGVLIGGAVILFTGWYGMDTLLSALLACLILRGAVNMTIACVKVLLEAAPECISTDALRDAVQGVPGVVAVTDTHVWSLSMETHAMTAHVCIDADHAEISEQILHEIQHLLLDEFNIEHSTLQIERRPCSSCYHSKADHASGCSLCIDCQRMAGNPRS